MEPMAVPFSVFMEEALYAPGTGFYERGGQAGRRGDFLTSPEVGPLFGAVVARALDAWWQDMGRPDPFVVDEHGAGPGTLARSVTAAAPACGPALRWTLVERSMAQRALHPPHLPHVGDLATVGDRWTEPGRGPLVASSGSPPRRPVLAPDHRAHRDSTEQEPQSRPPKPRAHVILANELLDNLPFDLFEKGRSGRWYEVRVAPGPDAVLVDASEADAALLDQLCATASTGTRAPLLRRAGQWVAHRLVDLCSGGRLVVIDYASTTARLSVDYQDEWLRTYRSHGRGTGPLDAPGEQDITVELCVDQLARAARPPDEQQSQADFLLRWGIDDLVAEGREAWTGRTGPPDLGLLRLRSRAIEAEALLDLSGLGAFQVLQWMGR